MFIPINRYSLVWALITVALLAIVTRGFTITNQFWGIAIIILTTVGTAVWWIIDTRRKAK